MSSSTAPDVSAGRLRMKAPDSDTRLHGWRLNTVRAAIFTAMAFTLGLYALALPNLAPRSAILCSSSSDISSDSCFIAPQQVAPLASLGITPSALAMTLTILSYVSILLVSGVAAVLIWRRSDDWMALFLALTLMLMPANFTSVMTGLPDVLQGMGQICSDASNVTLYVLIGIFPSGRFVPRWLWLPILVILIDAVTPLPTFLAVALAANPEVFLGIFGFTTLGAVVCLIAGQIYRYRRVATPIQRQQIKWGVSGLVLTIIANQAFWQTIIWIPALQRPDSLYILLAAPDSFLMICFLAIFFGVAILRSRLYDIDVIIRRTVIYGLLTTILAGVYAAGVIGGRFALRALTGVTALDTPILIVLSTLVVAALFQPLRGRIQTTIDRRFYRQAYDARRALERFSAGLREEVDLPALRARLTEVVAETVQPTSVSLWLRDGPSPDQPR